MNLDIANKLYEREYSDSVAYEHFMRMLKTGLHLAQHHPIGDKLYVHRIFQHDELRAVNVALAYNQEMMMMLLLEK